MRTRGLLTSLVIGFTAVFCACNNGPECADLEKDVQAGVAAFTPASPNTCAVDSDCGTFGTAVSWNDQICVSGCLATAATAVAAEETAFLANDPRVTIPCERLVNAGCRSPEPLAFCPACTPHCVSGNCQCNR